MSMVKVSWFYIDQSKLLKLCDRCTGKASNKRNKKLLNCYEPFLIYLQHNILDLAFSIFTT